MRNLVKRDGSVALPSVEQDSLILALDRQAAKAVYNIR